MINRKTIQNIISLLVIVFIFYLIGKNIGKNYGEIKEHLWKFNPYLLILSFVSLFPPMFLLAYVWQSLLKNMGLNLGYTDTFSIYFIGNLGKYIPGKIWQFFMMAYIAKDKGLSAGKAFSASFVGQTLSITSGLLIAFITLGLSFINYITNPVYITFAALFIIFLFILFFKPKSIEQLGNRVAKMLGRSPSLRLDFSPEKFAIYIALYSIIWLSVGLTFYIICRSFIYVSLKQIPFVIGTFSASVVIGFLAVFAPGGLGVREGIIVLIMQAGKITTPTLASVAAIAARLIFTLNELALFLLAFLFHSKEARNGKEKKDTEKKDQP